MDILQNLMAIHLVRFHIKTSMIVRISLSHFGFFFYGIQLVHGEVCFKKEKQYNKKHQVFCYGQMKGGSI